MGTFNTPNSPKIYFRDELIDEVTSEELLQDFDYSVTKGKYTLNATITPTLVGGYYWGVYFDLEASIVAYYEDAIYGELLILDGLDSDTKDIEDITLEDIKANVESCDIVDSDTLDIKGIIMPMLMELNIAIYKHYGKVMIDTFGYCNIVVGGWSSTNEPIEDYIKGLELKLKEY